MENNLTVEMPEENDEIYKECLEYLRKMKETVQANLKTTVSYDNHHSKINDNFILTYVERNCKCLEWWL